MDAKGSALLLATGGTLVHTVPDGECHLITIRVANVDNSTDYEVLGQFGAGANLLNHRVTFESTYELMRDVALVGPAAITLSAELANRLYVTGSAKVCK